MHAIFSLLPLVAAILAVPQFLPQLARLRRTGETAGVSWSWAALTSVNNAAWASYFALSGFWTALVPAISATVLAGALAVMLARRLAGIPRRSAALALAWAALLIAAASLFGRAGLGAALTVAFLLQVTPSVWAAYRADRTTGIAAGTWLLIFGELLCWGVFGIYESDPRLIVLGATGVAASLLVLARVAKPHAHPRSGRGRNRGSPDHDRANRGPCHLDRVLQQAPELHLHDALARRPLAAGSAESLSQSTESAEDLRTPRKGVVP